MVDTVNEAKTCSLGKALSIKEQDEGDLYPDTGRPLDTTR